MELIDSQRCPATIAFDHFQYRCDLARGHRERHEANDGYSMPDLDRNDVTIRWADR